MMPAGSVRMACCEADELAGEDGAQRDADRSRGRELSGLAEAVLQVECSPFNDEQAQGGTDAPEQGGHGEGDLAEWVAPQ